MPVVCCVLGVFGIKESIGINRVAKKMMMNKIIDLFNVYSP